MFYPALFLLAALSAPKVFLVHSSVDDKLAGELAKRLEKAGCVVWMDHRNMLVGRWPKLIEAAIDSSTHIVWLLPKIGTSRCEWCEDEVLRGRRLGKEIVPVATRGAIPSLIVEGYNMVSWERAPLLCVKSSESKPGEQ